MRDSYHVRVFQKFPALSTPQSSPRSQSALVRPAAVLSAVCAHDKISTLVLFLTFCVSCFRVVPACVHHVQVYSPPPAQMVMLHPVVDEPYYYEQPPPEPIYEQPPPKPESPEPTIKREVCARVIFASV